MQRVQYQTIAASLLLAMTFGLLAAILDHHLAERLPWHEYIYLSVSDAGHHHDHGYDEGTIHHHHDGDPNHDLASDADSPVVSISGYSAAGSFWTMLSSGLALILLWPLVLEPLLIERLISHVGHILRPTFFPPPHRPPPTVS